MKLDVVKKILDVSELVQNKIPDVRGLGVLMLKYQTLNENISLLLIIINLLVTYWYKYKTKRINQ